MNDLLFFLQSFAIVFLVVWNYRLRSKVKKLSEIVIKDTLEKQQQTFCVNEIIEQLERENLLD